MAVVVVGGHTRNIGKTTLAELVLRATPELRWTAMKITQFGHGVCSANGEPCDCDTGEHTVAVSEERRSDTGTDTSRMLVAGAERVFWVRTRQGQLADALPTLKRHMAGAANVLLESNSILRFLRPDLYFAVLNDAVADFKPSALRYLDRADALFTPRGESPDVGLWEIAPSLIVAKTVFALGHDLPSEAVGWIRGKCERKSPAQPGFSKQEA